MLRQKPISTILNQRRSRRGRRWPKRWLYNWRWVPRKDQRRRKKKRRFTFFSNRVQRARGSNPGVARGVGGKWSDSSESLSETMMKSKFSDDRCRRWQQAKPKMDMHDLVLISEQYKITLELLPAWSKMTTANNRLIAEYRQLIYY